MKILFCDVGMGNELYEIIFFIYVSKIEAYEANSPLQVQTSSSSEVSKAKVRPLQGPTVVNLLHKLQFLTHK